MKLCPWQLTPGQHFRKHVKRICAGQTFNEDEVDLQRLIVDECLRSGGLLAKFSRHKAFARWARKVGSMEQTCKRLQERTNPEVTHV